MLLEIANLSRSTFNYVKSHMDDKVRKDEAILKEIESIFEENNGKYGYPRITIELQNRGYNINKKRVARIMRENNIKAVKENEDITRTKELWVSLHLISLTETSLLQVHIRN